MVETVPRKNLRHPENAESFLKWNYDQLYFVAQFSRQQVFNSKRYLPRLNLRRLCASIHPVRTRISVLSTFKEIDRDD